MNTRNLVFIIIGSIVLMILFLIVLTRDPLYSYFSDTGQIGDTIGGITAPVIGLFATILLYLSLSAQGKANELIKEELNQSKKRSNFNILNSVLLEIRGNISELVYSYSIEDKGEKIIREFDECQALIEFTNYLKKFEPVLVEHINFISELNYIINVFAILLKKINTDELLKNDENLIRLRVHHLYLSKLDKYMIELCTVLEKKDIKYSFTIKFKELQKLFELNNKEII